MSRHETDAIERVRRLAQQAKYVPVSVPGALVSRVCCLDCRLEIASSAFDWHVKNVHGSPQLKEKW